MIWEFDFVADVRMISLPLLICLSYIGDSTVRGRTFIGVVGGVVVVLGYLSGLIVCLFWLSVPFGTVVLVRVVGNLGLGVVGSSLLSLLYSDI